jgi:hypothetical protein
MLQSGKNHRTLDTGCLIKNASTHNFFIYYPISMNKKTEDMVFHALRSSHKIFFFLALFSVAYDSQLFFFFNGHMQFFRLSLIKFFFLNLTMY